MAVLDVAPSPTRLTAAAGGRGGRWYVLLEGSDRRVQEHYPLIEITVVEEGGVSNRALVGAGDLPRAILNPPTTMAALAGQPPFAQAFPALRIGVANLTVNHLQWV